MHVLDPVPRRLHLELCGGISLVGTSHDAGVTVS
jgi:hypothetical protein